MIVLISVSACGGGGGGAAPTSTSGGSSSSGGGGSSGGDSGGSSGGGSANGDSFQWQDVTDEDLLAIFPSNTNSYIQLSLSETVTGWDIGYDQYTYNMKADGRIGDIFYFEPFSENGYEAYIIGASNNDVTIATGWTSTPEDEAEWFLVAQGSTATNLPTGLQYFSGQYAAINNMGENMGVWEMELLIDYQNIQNSYGRNLGAYDEIRIDFSANTNGALQGTISDPNHDYNLATFEHYGQIGTTIAGGYSNNNGAGILIADHAGSLSSP